MKSLFVATLALGSALTASAFYIPGTGPIAYGEGDVVNINVNGLHSIKNIVPYDYYYAPFCRPDVLVGRHETIGEILSGENQRSSPYYVNMMLDDNCQILDCATPLTDESAPLFEKLIEQEYRAYMVVDNLAAFKNATAVFQGRCSAKFKQIAYQRGYALGVPKACTGGPSLINNHLHFTVQYHRVDKGQLFVMGEAGAAVDGEIKGQLKKKDKKKKKKLKAGEDEDNFLVVGVTIEPFSVAWPEGGPKADTCHEEFNPYSANIVPLTTKHRGNIYWTYGVTWVEEPNIRWASRWDSYLHTSVADTNDRIHWLSILNTILIVMCLVSTIFVAIVRVLRRQIAQYNLSFELSNEENREALREEGGWKVVASDVFRAPAHPELLTIAASSGAQIFTMVLSTLTISLVGYLSPARRGAFMTALLATFVLSSTICGYIAARMHLKLGGLRSWPLIFKSCSLVPAAVFSAFVFINAILRANKSSGAVPIVTLLSLLSLWLLVSIPLALVGASYGFRVLPGANPKKVGAIPRPIDPSLEPDYLKTNILFLVTGALPLAALFLELRFILASVWQGVVYYVFGFLTIIFVLWAITVALTAIVVTYYKLTAENYNWWWVSFLAPSSCGAHIALFFIYYFYTSLTISSSVATIMYIVYMGLVTVLYTLCAGAVGLFATWQFVFTIYGNLKNE